MERMFSGAAEEQSQTRAFVCTPGFAEAFVVAHSIAAKQASSMHARARKRSSVATSVARPSTFPSLAAFDRSS